MVGIVESTSVLKGAVPSQVMLVHKHKLEDDSYELSAEYLAQEETRKDQELKRQDNDFETPNNRAPFTVLSYLEEDNGSFVVTTEYDETHLF